MADKALLLFDLDGTINNSLPGISYCYRKTAEEYGIYDLTDEFIHKGLCGPFFDNIKMILDIPDEEVNDAIQRYVRYYASEGQRMSSMFPGVKSTLTELKNRGYRIGVATMMADVYAKSTLSNYGIDSIFDTIHGASLEVPMTKADIIRMCLEDTRMEPADAFLVGDGIDDHMAANATGIGFVGATFGYQVDAEYCSKNGVRSIGQFSDMLELFR